ncbi:MAG: GDP-mannose mannosyl hydrolase [Pseudomonadales bacterium]
MNDDDFLQIIDATPLVAIDLILKNTEGLYFLAKRCNKPAQGYWFVPGGRVRKNELLADAMRRISIAELGTEVEFSEATLIGAYEHLYDDNFKAVEGIQTHYVCLGYSAKLSSQAMISTDEQHSDYRWWALDEILSSTEVHENTKAYFR